ncbi:MAG: hypothetical protein ACP5UT_16315 [Bryobacteraceae bacterium]
MSLYVIRLAGGKELEADDLIIDPKNQWMQYIVPYQHNRAMLRMEQVQGISEKTSGIGDPQQFSPGEIPRGWKRPFARRKPR